MEFFVFEKFEKVVQLKIILMKLFKQSNIVLISEEAY